MMALVTYPIRSKPKAKSLFLDVVYTAVRTLLTNSTIASEKYLDPGTEANYLEFTKKANFQPDSLVLSDGTKAHWVGPRKADKTFVYYHGE